MDNLSAIIGKIKKKLLAYNKRLKTIFKKKTIIWMIGDSTMCVYDKTYAPVQGWGMPFADYFDETTIIKNKAKGGYSTKTFIQQNYWKTIANKLKKGNFVLIQFGHNDENKEALNIYTSPNDYRLNLLQFINETKKKNAYPILFTPVARRIFDDYAQIIDTHQPYAEIVKETATVENLPFIDLNKITIDLLQAFGIENSKLLFNYLLPNENPNYPNGKNDDEHFNEFGARKVAELVLAEIKKQQLPLANKIVKGFR